MVELIHETQFGVLMGNILCLTKDLLKYSPKENFRWKIFQQFVVLGCQVVVGGVGGG